MLETAHDPVLLWSTGKDSTLLYHVIKEIGYDIPLLVFSQFWNSEQKQFLTDIIKKFDITPFYYKPNSIYFPLQKQLVMLVSIGGTEMPIIMDNIDDNNICALELTDKIMSDPSPIPAYIWDTTIIGSKSSDTHSLLKDKVLDFSNFESTTKIEVPLWNWSDEEIMKAIFYLGIELDEHIYSNGTFQVNEQKNTGNFIGCMKCINSTISVVCPKTGKLIKFP